MMLLHEKQAIYWRLAYPEVEETCEEPRLTIDDFILGPFDRERLNEDPPESDWSDWFPPPPRMTEWELYDLTDWVEIEAAKHDLLPDPDTYPVEDYFFDRRNMTPKMTPIMIPVPPAPILERAVGYQNNHDARFLALWWEPAGDEVMVSDGLVTFTGHWSGYLSYVHHKTVYPFLASYNLGSSDDPAEYHLVIDLQERKAYVALSKEAEKVLAGNWPQETNQVEPISLSVEDFETLLQDFIEQTQNLTTMSDLTQHMEEDQKAVRTLMRCLDDK